MRASIGGLDRLHHGKRLQAERGQALVAQPDGQLRRARGRLQLDVAGAAYARHGGRHRLRVAVEQIEIGAVQVDDERCGKAGDGLFDAFGQERVDCEGHARKLVATLAGERVAYVRADTLLFLAGSAPIDFVLAIVGTEKVSAPHARRSRSLRLPPSIEPMA